MSGIEFIFRCSFEIIRTLASQLNSIFPSFPLKRIPTSYFTVSFAFDPFNQKGLAESF